MGLQKVVTIRVTNEDYDHLNKMVNQNELTITDITRAFYKYIIDDGEIPDQIKKFISPSKSRVIKK